jgi:hypothetical protein
MSGLNIDKLIPKAAMFEWIQTCLACPVQFDIYYNNTRIAYFRFRHSVLTVYNYDKDEIGDDLIYIDEDNYDTSYLDQSEFDEIVPIVEQKIKEYLITTGYAKICPICNNLFVPNVEHRKACSKCLEQANMENIRQMMQTLDTLGWSELIDPRWEDKVIQDLKTYYRKDIPIIDIYKLLEIVLW